MHQSGKNSCQESQDFFKSLNFLPLLENFEILFKFYQIMSLKILWAHNSYVQIMIKKPSSTKL